MERPRARPRHGLDPRPAALLVALAALWIGLGAASGVLAEDAQPPTATADASPPDAPADPAAAPPSPSPEATAPAPRRGAARGYVGIHLLGIRALDVAAGTFDADFHVWVRTREGAGVSLDALTAVNGNAAKEPVGEEQVSGKWRRRMWRMSGTFRADFPLSTFPFDRHTVPIVICVEDRSARDLLLEPDVEGSGVAQGLVIPGWTYERRFGAHAAIVPLGPRFGEDSGERSEVHFKVFIERPVVSLLMKILVPIILCLAMSHGAFFVAPAEFGTRVALITTAIFAAIGVHYALAEMLPSTSYMTIADVYFLLVYVFLFIELTTSIISHSLEQASRQRAVRRLDLAVRVLAPLVFLGGLVSSSWTAAGDRLSSAFEAAPVVTSTRPELRLGLARRPGVYGVNAIGSHERLLRRLAIAPLVESDDQGRPRAVLAASVPSYRNDSLRVGDDRTTHVHWRIRPGARWGDGTPVTPDDIVRPSTATSFVTFRGRPEIDVPEARDGAFDLTYEGVRPHVIFDAVLFPRARLAGLSLDEQVALSDTALPPLSGPFILRSVEEEGRLLRYERNPHHVPPAALERIVVRVYATREELHLAFRRGEVDLVPPGDVTVVEAAALEQEVSGARALVTDGPSVFQLLVNCDDPVLKDARVRRALLLAIDRERLAREVVGGQASVAHSWLVPQHPLHFAGVTRRLFDPAAAARLLDAAGCRMGPDGRRLAPDGSPLRLEVGRGSGHPGAVIEAIAGDWGRLGIDVRYEVREQALYFQSYLGRLEFPHVAFAGSDIAPHETGVVWWTEGWIPGEENGWRGFNTSRWRDPRIEEIYDEVRQTIATEDMQDLLERQQRIFAEELPSLPLYVAKQAVLCGPGLEGVRPHVQGEGSLSWNAAEWRFVAKRKLDLSFQSGDAKGAGGK